MSPKRLPFAVDPTDPGGPFGDVYQSAAELIGKRWTAAIVFAITRNQCRFGELRALIPQLSERMLALRLKELEVAGVVRRDVYAETPVRIEYVLTKHGEALRPILIAINRWSAER